MHFGISMTCFAAVFLLTRLLYEPPNAPDPIAIAARSHPLPTWFRYATWATLAGSIIVAYVGAYMRHSGNELACHTWPGLVAIPAIALRESTMQSAHSAS